MTDQELRDAIHAATLEQRYELAAIEAVLPVLERIASRYSGTREGNRIATRARQSSGTIRSILELAEAYR